MDPFEVSPACLQLGLRAGAIVFRNLRIAPRSESLNDLIVTEMDRIRAEFDAPSEIRALPEIQRLHAILKSVNVKPKSRPPSTQKLLEFAWKRGALPEVNNLVDAYNLVSVQTRCSLGAHDLDRFQPPVRLCLFDGGETFRPLGSDLEQAIVVGEFGYVDDNRQVVCRLDSLQADFSKVTMATKNVLLIIESTTLHDSSYLADVCRQVRELVVSECGGDCEVVGWP